MSMLTKRSSILTAILILAAIAPWVLPNYHLHTLTIAGIFVMLTSGLNLIHGYVGRLSLGHTAFYGLGGYTAALLSAKFGFGLLLTIPAAVGVAVLSGLAIGHITLRFRGAHFVLVTLAFAAILHLLANNLVDFTGGPMGVSGIISPLVHQNWGNFNLFGSKASFYWLVLGLDVLAVYIVWRVVNSPLGDAMVAIREDGYRGIDRHQRVPLFHVRLCAGSRDGRGGWRSLCPLRHLPQPGNFPFQHHDHDPRHGHPGERRHRSGTSDRQCACRDLAGSVAPA